MLDGHRFPAGQVERIPVDGQGVVDLSWLAARLQRAGGERVLVSLQAANNETGVIQPVAEAAALVHHYRGLLHADAVQAAGKIPCDIKALGADVLTLSAHKLGGPKGVGAIVMASDAIEIGDRLIRGGGQERGYRAGTENVAGIVGFGVAAELAGRDRDGLSGPFPGPCSHNPDPSCRQSNQRGGVRGADARGCRTPWPSRSPASAPRRR